MAKSAVSSPMPPSVAAELFSWWQDEIRGLWGRKTRDTASPVDIPSRADMVDITIVRGGVQIGAASEKLPLAELATQKPHKPGKWVTIRLDSHRAIKRRLADHRIPLSRAYRMAELDVAANTPFELASVHILFCKPTGANTATEYLLVRRDVLDPVMDWIGSAKCKIHSVSMSDGNASCAVAGYAGDHFNGSNRVLRTLQRHGFSLAIALMAGIACYNYLSVINTATKSIEARIEAIEPAASKARKAFKARSEELVRLRALYRERADYTPLVRIFEELSQILPDGSYLNTLSQQKEKIRVSGFSNSAASLVALIDSSKLFKSPRFTSAVLKVPGRDGEQFNMEIEIEHAD